MGNDEWEKQAQSNFWNPQEPGEEIRGKVEKIIEGQYGLHYIIKLDDGNRITTPAHKVLLNRMQNVKVGNTVRITFDGSDLPSIKGRMPTKLYTVYIRKE